jgi:thiol-disulfide isomerase/thioredoxin
MHLVYVLSLVEKYVQKLMKRLKRYCSTSCFILISLISLSQERKEIRSNLLDTNMIVLDEQGKTLKYYQYQKLLNSGEYTFMRTVGQANFVLKKLSSEEQVKYSELVETLMAVKSPMLKKGEKLDMSPFSDILAKEESEQKVKVLIFWSSACPPCTESFESINETLKQISNRDEVLMLAVTGDSQTVASQKLKEKPLLYAKLISNASSVFKYYQHYTTPIFVIADKNDVIRFSVDGIGPQMINAFKTQLRAVLTQ